MAKKDQSSIFDERLEDPTLEELLEKRVELEGPAAEYRTIGKDIRKHIEKNYPALINAEDGAGDGEEDDDEEDRGSGWAICGGFRFRPKATPRAAGEVKIGAGINWACPVERID
jgi:hypothetical protein